METIVQIITSVVTAFAAILALVLSIVTIRKNNKQALFERRLKVFLTVKWMKELCDAHKPLAKSYLEDAKKDPIRKIDYLFDLMTNCSYLEEIQGTLKHTLEDEYQYKYLKKMESFRNMCEETSLIFPETVGSNLSDFIFYYEEMLVAMYKYQVAIKGIEKECNESKIELPKDDDLEKRERYVLVNYLKGTFELADRLSQNGTLEKAKKQIRL